MKRFPSLNKELTYLSKLCDKATKEIEALPDDVDTDNLILIFNTLSHLISQGEYKVIDTLLEKDAPLQFVYDYFDNHYSKNELMETAREMYRQSLLAITGSYEKQNGIYRYYISDDYYYYFDNDNTSCGVSCYGAFIETMSDDTVFDFECSYDDFINDTTITEKLGLLMFITGDEFRTISSPTYGLNEDYDR